MPWPWRASATAIVVVLLVHQFGLGAGAAATAIALLWCIRRGPGPMLMALPALLATAQPGPRPAAAPPPGPLRLCGTVAGEVLPSRHDDGVRFTLVRNGRRLSVHADGDPDLRPGDRVTAVARAAAPALADGEVSVHVPRGGLSIEHQGLSLPALAASCRRALAAQLQARVAGDRGALLQSLVLGRGPATAPELQQAHRATGLSHLLAVSGSHASIVAMLLGLLPFSGRPRPRHGPWRTRIGLLLLLLYGGITGMDPPVFRAVVAFTLLALAQQRGRPVRLPAALGLPALLTCIVTPEGVLGASFQLSYAAVFGLSLTRRAEGRLATLRTALRASFWATLCTAPLTLWWFGQLAPWTIVLTPLLGPVVALLLLDGLVMAAIGCCCAPLADLLALPLRPLLAFYCNAVLAADRLPGTPIFAPTTPAPAVLGLAACIAALLLLRWPRRRTVLGAIVLLCLPHFLPMPAPGEGRLLLAAIGHGQACLCTMPDGTNVVVDCGSMQHPGLPARKLVAAMPRRIVDVLILTHEDSDHTGGVDDLLSRLPVRRAIVPRALLEAPLGRRLRGQGVQLTTLAPGEHTAPRPDLEVSCPAGSGPRGNDRSLWVRIGFAGMSALLTGDAEQQGVDAALRDGLAGPSDVLVLPHHGRRNDRITALLDAVQPRLCLCSNRAGEGRSAQGRVAQARGIEVLATGELGDLDIRIGARIELHTALPRTLAR